MTLLKRNITFIGILLPVLSFGQIISVLDSTGTLPGNKNNGIISDIYDTTGQRQFIDWTTTLGDFEDIKTITQKELKEKIAQTQTVTMPNTKHYTLKGKQLNLPSVKDENGIDLYMLTDEGVSIYMAMLEPVYYQETTQDLIKWIRYFAYDKRDYTKRAFARYDKWKEFINKTFTQYGVPTEIAELCIVESACTSKAVSSAGAAGMWQIMPQTAREWGMRVDASIDERNDPIKSTFVAAKILSASHKICSDWTLCIAGYNCGMGRINGKIKSSGTIAWPVIKPKLPKETQQYIPSLLAMHYVWEYRKELGLDTF